MHAHVRVFFLKCLIRDVFRQWYIFMFQVYKKYIRIRKCYKRTGGKFSARIIHRLTQVHWYVLDWLKCQSILNICIFTQDI